MKNLYTGRANVKISQHKLFARLTSRKVDPYLREIDLLNILKSLILINVLMVSLDAIKAHCGLI